MLNKKHKTLALGLASFSMLYLSGITAQAAQMEDNPITPLSIEEESRVEESSLDGESLQAVSLPQEEADPHSAIFDFNAEEGVVKGFAEDYEPDSSTLTIPSTINGVDVKKLGRQAFSREGLTAVDLPEGLEELGQGSLQVNSLKVLDLPTTTKTIDHFALANNSDLVEVHLNEGLETIGNYSFFGSESLKSIELPASLEHLGNLAFRKSGIGGEVVFGPNLKMVGNQVFRDTPEEITIGISKGEAPLYIGIDVFEPHQNKVDIPQNRPIHLNARAFQAEGDIVLDGGVVEVRDIADASVVDQAIRQAVQLYSGTEAVKVPVTWQVNADQLTYDEASGLYQAKGQFKAHDEVAGRYADAMSSLKPQVYLKQLEAHQRPPLSDISWTGEDFEYGLLDYKPPLEEQYQVFGINSFSALGLEKAKQQKDLIIPNRVTFERDGQIFDKEIMGIGESAFKDIPLNRLVIPERDHEFIIQGSAFENTGLSHVEFGEGLEFIGPRAFYDNQLREVTLPSTLWATGSQSFMHNSIESLNIHPEVERLQIDNYSFAHNQLTSVDLPYDVFKIREYVFKANPGVESIAEEKLMAGDPADTGVVRLNTLNPHHLRVDTYIAPSPYHELVNLAPHISRDGLFTSLRTAQDVLEENSNLSQRDRYDLTRQIAASKRLFSDPSSTQDEINSHQEALEELIDTHALDHLPLFRQTLDQAQRVNPDLYTADSLKQLEEAIQDARQVLASDYTDESLALAIQHLDHAMEQLEIVDHLSYSHADFTYDGTTITGLSQAGQAKKEINKHLIIPPTNPDGQAIIAIGNQAFQSNARYGSDTSQSQGGFNSVDIPDTVRHIGDRAFFSNHFTSVDFPEALESIGTAAFNGNNIQSIVLPEGLTSIGPGAFALNESQAVSIPSSLKEISSGAFSRNITMSDLSLSEGNTVIGQSAFIGAPLTVLDIPSTVEEIKRMAFQANRFEELNIPGNVKRIEANAFNQNAKWPRLKKLTLEEGVESLGRLAFGNGLLTQVFLPNSIKDLDPRAFEGQRTETGEPIVVQLYSKNPDHLAFNTAESANNHQVILVEDNLDYTAEDFTYEGTTLTGFSDRGQVKFVLNKDVVLPELNLEGESIEAIGADAFFITEGVSWNRSFANSPHGMQSVIIPQTVTSIGPNAFRLNSLTAIDLPDGLVSIGSLAFNGNQLEEVIIPDSVTQLGQGAFSANPTRQAYISENVSEIPNGLFGRNGRLEQVNIPHGVTAIGQSAFVGAPIKELIIPNTVESIGRLAFNTNHLERLEIPSSVKSIGAQAFQQKEAAEFPDLKELILNEGLESIGSNAFEGTGLKEVFLPISLKELAADAFDTVLDEDGKEIQVKLYTRNPDHLAFNTEESMDHQLVILIEEETNQEEMSRDIVLVYDIHTRYSNQLEAGDSRVIRPGQNGLLRVDERITYQDGKEIDRTIISTEVVRQPIHAIVEVGQTPTDIDKADQTAIKREESRFVSIPFESQVVKRPDLAPDQLNIVQLGQEGLIQIDEIVSYVDGLVIDRQLLSSAILRPASNEIIEVGSKVSRPPVKNTNDTSAPIENGQSQMKDTQLGGSAVKEESSPEDSELEIPTAGGEEESQADGQEKELVGSNQESAKEEPSPLDSNPTTDSDQQAVSSQTNNSPSQEPATEEPELERPTLTGEEKPQDDGQKEELFEVIQVPTKDELSSLDPKLSTNLDHQAASFQTDELPGHEPSPGEPELEIEISMDSDDLLKINGLAEEEFQFQQVEVQMDDQKTSRLSDGVNHSTANPDQAQLPQTGVTNAAAFLGWTSLIGGLGLRLRKRD